MTDAGLKNPAFYYTCRYTTIPKKHPNFPEFSRIFRLFRLSKKITFHAEIHENTHKYQKPLISQRFCYHDPDENRTRDTAVKGYQEVPNIATNRHRYTGLRYSYLSNLASSLAFTPLFFSFFASRKCVYLSFVIVMDEWPITCCASNSETPSSSSMLAYSCRN